MSEYVFRTDEPIKSCSECDYRCGLNIIARQDLDARHEHCPLVELPPHGRLVDADKIKKKVELFTITRADDYLKVVVNGNIIVEKILDDAPTVLEASEERE